MSNAIKKSLVGGALTIAGSLAFAVPAAAQATRTWVSGEGDDVNPCSRTAPCKTFAGAISKTAAGGEIDCLDNGGFGTLTITKSITVDCTGHLGSVLNSGGINGFVVNDSATASPGTAKVILRGLTINGAGTTPGLNAIRFISGASLVLEDVMIQNQNGYGISFQPAAVAKLSVKRVNIVNGLANTGGGILLQPTGTGSATADLADLRIASGLGTGLRVDATGNTGTAGINAELNNVRIVEYANGVFLFAPAGNAAPIKVMIVDSTLANNSGPGVLANGTPITGLLSNTSITNNAAGLVVSGATILSYGDNRLFGNGANNSFPITIQKN